MISDLINHARGIGESELRAPEEGSGVVRAEKFTQCVISVGKYPQPEHASLAQLVFGQHAIDCALKHLHA